MSNRLETTANVAVIVGVVAFLAVVARNHFLQPRAGAGLPAREALLGKTIRLPGVIPSSARGTIVLAVSTTCHYCKESWPFYRELGARLNGKVDTVAILPQPQPQAEAYIEEAGIPVSRVASVDLTSIGVVATPTVMLLDGTGKVQDVWIGYLGDAKQRERLLARAVADSDASGAARLRPSPANRDATSR